ncbi:MAG: protein-disulfide reductase DsbD domain-containing protein, partial [Pseudomonadota bacterium]|nr:protein-disulfide reductase DsbD domain-containing protein [Pseudomonadota bacterium]
MKPNSLSYFVKVIIVTFFCKAAIAFTNSAIAEIAASTWFKTKETQVRLISGSETIGKSGKTQLGLQFKLKDGWKIYWRSPGEAGFPPSINWNQSTNFEDADFYWPSPERFKVLDLQTIGYKKEVIFPIVVKTKDSNNTLKLVAKLSYLTCNKICIPYDTILELDLNAGESVETPFNNLIETFLSRVPKENTAGLIIKSASITYSQNIFKARPGKRFIRIITNSEPPFNNPDIFAEGPKGVSFSSPQLTLSS